MPRNKKTICPIETVLQLVGNKWKIVIIRDLLTGAKRFGEVKTSTGCSQKVLTANLRELEADGLVNRKVFAQVPPKVEYSLTDLGKSLEIVVATMAEWGSDYLEYCKLKSKIEAKRNLHS